MSSQQSRSTLHANERQPPAKNLHQIEQNVGIPEFNQNHDNTSYATTNTVTRIVHTINRDTENVSEISSVKRRAEERMKEIEIEVETRLQIERAQFDRKTLELEMQMRELVIQHQLREKERDLERQLQKTALEKDDVLNRLRRVTSHLSVGPQRERCLGVGEFDGRHSNTKWTKSSLRRQP